MSDPKELVSVYKGENTTEAHLVMNLLLDEGIDASVSEENEPLAGLSIAAPDVLVRREDAERARAIIEKYDDVQEARADRPDWKCPACGAHVIGAVDNCESCGAARPGTEEDDDEGDESE